MSTTVDDSLIALLGLVGLGLAIALYIWTALALAAMFRKMGDASWKGWVPILNQATLLAWGGFTPWLILLLLVPVAGWLVVAVLTIVAAHRLNPGFGYGAAMTVLAALLFVVWASILGFGPARWLGARSPFARSGMPASSSVPGVERERTAESAARGVAGAEALEQRVLPEPFAFAPPPAEVAPAWVPPDIATTSQPPRTSATPSETPRSEASDPVAAPPHPLAEAPLGPLRTGAVPVTPVAAAVTPPATDDDRWPSEVDEVSAISPSPFPPSTAAGSGARHVTPPVGEGGGAPISFVPGRRAAVPSEPEEPVLRSRASRGDWSPARSGEPADADFPEMSGEVSAVVGSPAAGAPRSATHAVSAQQRRLEPFGDEDEDLDHTVIARRKRPRWQLVTRAGAPIPLHADVVILGRQPARDASRPGAQLVPIADETRTVSKTHARLELKSDGWHITDLHSTNGVLLPSLLGADIEAEPGTAVSAGERFFLGDAEFRIVHAEG